MAHASTTTLTYQAIYLMQTARAATRTSREARCKRLARDCRRPAQSRGMALPQSNVCESSYSTCTLDASFSMYVYLLFMTAFVTACLGGAQPASALTSRIESRDTRLAMCQIMTSAMHGRVQRQWRLQGAFASSSKQVLHARRCALLPPQQQLAHPDTAKRSCELRS